RAVDALDSLELDVGGRRRPRDERQRPSLEPSEGGERLRHRLHDLVGADDADMEVWDERQRAPALRRPTCEDERPGFRNRDGAPGEDTVESVEVVRTEAVILDHVRRPPRLGETRRDADPAAAG